jgi:hypothetical protein
VSAGRKCVCKNEKLSTIGTNHFVANGFNHWSFDHPAKEDVVDMDDKKGREMSLFHSSCKAMPAASNICGSRMIHNE